MSGYGGELAALLTALCWSGSSVLFSLAGRRAGARVVNHVRLWVAWLALLGLHALLAGALFPFSAGGKRLAWLGLSGVVGFVLGDAMLFEALVRLGARLSMLLMTLTPIFSALLGWVFLGEVLGALRLGAVTLTVAGIFWVIAAGSGTGEAKRPHPLPGVLLGVGGALGQAAGLLFSKIGMAGGFSPVSANLIRLTAATGLMGLLALLQGRLGADFASLRDRILLRQVLGGSFLGPVLGVALSLYAVAHAALGVAATLMALSPVILLPVAHFFLSEPVTRRAIAGTLIAVAGAALLFVFR